MISFALLLLLLSVIRVDGFVPLQHNSSPNPTRVFASSALESMTVKELRQVLKDSDLNRRGLLTSLKRKQDLIDYLKQHGANQGDDENETKRNEIRQNQETQSLNKTPVEKEELPPPLQPSLLGASPDLSSCIPPMLQERMVQKEITSLLPIQVESFQRIYSGRDAVLQAPTGSGKTLAYVLPLLSRKKQSFAWQRQRIASPRIIVIVPNRELARQVGKEWTKFSKVSSSVATVFGGVPLERHVALLKPKPHVVVATPGRLRELVREGNLDYSQVSTLVLDEADTLLDKADSPDIFAIIQDLEEAVGEREEEDAEYQLVLVSATINDNVVVFTKELEISPRAFIRVQGSESKILPSAANGSRQLGTRQATPAVQHWHISCRSSARPLITSNLISIFNPRLTIVFVPTKAETESVAFFLSNKLLKGNVCVLHGDMVQSARSRTIAQIRESSTDMPQVLVATDVASRGLDLPNVDLVVQFGVPKLAGRDGTYSTELYTHRTGRTGRVRRSAYGAGESANAVLLYDPAMGEGRLIPELEREVEEELGIQMLPKPIPSSAQVVDAAYKQTTESLLRDSGENNELISYFRSRIHADERIDTEDPSDLLDHLARAMAALSNLDASTSPSKPNMSLLTGSEVDRTLHLVCHDTPLTPPEVTRFCKNLGSGKLGRVVICQDGSAVFDLPIKRANKLVQAVADDSTSDWLLKIPLTLPDI